MLFGVRLLTGSESNGFLSFSRPPVFEETARMFYVKRLSASTSSSASSMRPGIPHTSLEANAIYQNVYKRFLMLSMSLRRPTSMLLWKPLLDRHSKRTSKQTSRTPSSLRPQQAESQIHDLTRISHPMRVGLMSSPATHSFFAIEASSKRLATL